MDGSDSSKVMPGQSPMNRRITRGSTRALIDWYVATRSVPVSPARSAAMSARAASSRFDDRLGVAQQEVARLGHRDRARAAGALDELLADDALERQRSAG